MVDDEQLRDAENLVIWAFRTDNEEARRIVQVVRLPDVFAWATGGSPWSLGDSGVRFADAIETLRRLWETDSRGGR